jgi:hypothetical protein
MAPLPRRAAVAAALALLAAATVLPRPASAHGGHGGGPAKSKPKPQPKEPPRAANPYAGLPYAGCEGGYCAPQDFAAEAALFKAAAAGDVPAMQAALANPKVNASRNIVPDGDGFVRVVDVAVWMAAKHGRLDVMKVGAGRTGKGGLVAEETASEQSRGLEVVCMGASEGAGCTAGRCTCAL